MGTERTGTIPFMAVALSKRSYWDGLIKREYRHELESFIWILAFVCLRYKDGKAQSGTIVDAWMTSNYLQCAREKAHFWNSAADLMHLIDQVQSGFENVWELAWQLVDDAQQSHSHAERAIVKAAKNSSPLNKPNFSQTWNALVDRLKNFARGTSTINFVEELVQELKLEKLIPNT